MMKKDILIRSVAAVVVLGCVVCCAFAVAAAVAADQRGSAIHDNKPVTFSLLWREVSRMPPEALVTWGPLLSEGWVQATLSVALILALIALTLAVYPRILQRHVAVIAGLGAVLGLLSVFGLWGLFYLLVSILSTFAWGGLDGEWITELGLVYNVIGVLYLVVCLLLKRGAASPASDSTFTRPASPAAPGSSSRL
jgi:hypothetical protein